MTFTARLFGAKFGAKAVIRCRPVSRRKRAVDARGTSTLSTWITASGTFVMSEIVPMRAL